MKINIDDVISNLISSLTQEELVEFVKELNREIDDYDFTKELRSYFSDEVEEDEEEELIAYNFLDETD